MTGGEVRLLLLRSKRLQCGVGELLVSIEDIERLLILGPGSVEEKHVVHALKAPGLGGPPPVSPDDLVAKTGWPENRVEEDLQVVAGGRITVEIDRDEALHSPTGSRGET